MSFPPIPGSTDARPGARRGFVLGPDEGEAYHWLGTLTLAKVTGEASAGGLDIVDHRVPPGYAPPPHVHRDQDEVFYLIDGELKVTCGDDTWSASPGSLVFLPHGVPHGFVVADDRPARTLLINAPAGFAGLVADLGTPAATLELPAADATMPPPDEIAAASLRHGIEPAGGGEES